MWAPADSMGAQTARAPMLSGGPWKMFASPSNNTFRGHWGLSQDVKSGVTLRIVLRLQLHPNAKFCNPNPQFAPPIFFRFSQTSVAGEILVFLKSELHAKSLKAIIAVVELMCS